MKKFFALLLCFSLLMSLTGCLRIVIDGEDTSDQIVANGSIGLSVSTQNNPFFVSLVEGAKKQASEMGVQISAFDIMGYLFYPYLLLVSSLVAIFAFGEKKN